MLWRQPVDAETQHLALVGFLRGHFRIVVVVGERQSLVVVPALLAPLTKRADHPVVSNGEQPRRNA